MKKLLSMTLLLPLLCTSALSATCFDIKGEFLYLSPLLDNTYYGSQTVTGSPGNRVNVMSMFKPAFRIEADYFLPCSPASLEARYTYFNGGPGKHTIVALAGGLINDYASNVGGFEAEFDANFKYFAGDLVYKHPLLQTHAFNAALFGGMHYTWTRYLEQTQSGVGTLVFTKFKSFFWGVGPELGLDMSGRIWQNLSLVGNFRASLLVSEQRGFERIAAAGLVFSNFNDPIWSVFPAFDTRLGLNYCSLCKGWDVNFQVGYEFISYVGGHLRPQGAVNTITSTTLLTKTLCFHGPYAQIGVGF